LFLPYFSFSIVCHQLQKSRKLFAKPWPCGLMLWILSDFYYSVSLCLIFVIALICNHTLYCCLQTFEFQDKALRQLRREELMLVLPLVVIIRENLLLKFIECLMYLVYSRPNTSINLWI
jgi:hypothetical protein